MTAVFVWGKVDSEALGLSNSDTNVTTSPCLVRCLEDIRVRNLCCSEKHTLVCLENGTVQSCGINDFKQCGRSNVRQNLGHVKGLHNQTVVEVAAGSSHSVVLTESQKVFTWGRHDCGQLGRGDVYLRNRGKPKLVKSLSTLSVIQISCGNNHTLALTSESLVFSWGSNKHGQLGLGKCTDYFKDQPELISYVKGIPVLQITAGGNHSLICSLSGNIYGWGKNDYGQLGLRDAKDHSCPELCTFFRDQNVKYICSGNNHTACLTKNGCVFTFGDGRFGQLGHGNNNGEIMPKQVMALMDIEISQLACGKNHTLAYAQESDTLYVFGLGESGQLGISSMENINIPVSVGTTVFSLIADSASTKADFQMSELKLKQIYAGGDQSFIIAADSNNPDDFRKYGKSRQILTITQEICRMLQSLSPQQTLSHEILDDIKKIFSSSSCLNGSFLLKNDDIYDSGRSQINIDMEKVKTFFQDVQKYPDLVQMINRKIEKDLIIMFSNSSQVSEALHVFLILPVSSVFDQLEKYSSIHCPFGNCFLSLEREAIEIIELWWQSNQKFFSHLVKIYKQCFAYLLNLLPQMNFLELEKWEQCCLQCMKMLKLLHQANERGNIIPYTDFYMPEVQNFIQNLVYNRILGIRLQDSLCSTYQFLLDGVTKSLLFQAYSNIQMVMTMCQDMLLSQIHLFPYLQELPAQSFQFNLSCSRQNLTEDTFRELNSIPPECFKKRLMVIFEGEAGGDGVTKEFFLLLFQEVLTPEFNMFITDDKSKLVWFNSSTVKEPALFETIGILCGLMIYNSVNVDLHFPLALYKKLLKQHVTLDDVKELMPTVGSGLKDVLDFDDADAFEDVFCLSFVYGSNESNELISGGANQRVTQTNKKEFVDLYVDYLFNKSVQAQFNAFIDGVYTVCDKNSLSSFQPEELRAMVEGNEDYDFCVLEQNTDYKGDYSRHHPTIEFFWEVFFDLSLKKKKKFLLFLTSSDRIPITGMKFMKMTIQSSEHDEEFLPKSQTCLNLLHLPVYKTKEKLKSKLKIAIQTEGFHLYDTPA